MKKRIRTNTYWDVVTYIFRSQFVDYLYLLYVNLDIFVKSVFTFVGNIHFHM